MMKFFGVGVSMIGFKSHLPHQTASVKFLRHWGLSFADRWMP
jgi:hypothetical protein